MTLKRLLGRFEAPTAEIQEWEWYARNHRRNASEKAAPLGTEWNTPEGIGVDSDPTSVVEHIGSRVVMPFLGAPNCLLEIGAGGGRFTEFFVSRIPRILAADTSPTMIRILRERFAAEPTVATVQLNGRDLQPIEDGSIDAVFSYDVFVHLPAWELFNYLVEIRRVLVPGGRAIIHHGSSFSELGWKKFMGDAERARRGEAPRGRFQLMTPSVMSELATRSGLEVVELVTEVVRRDCIALLRRPS